MSVADAVRKELEGFPPELRDSGTAAVAVAMAEKIDTGKGSPSECAKVIVDALKVLRDLAPPPEQKGKIVDIRAKQHERLRLRSGQGGSAA